MYGELLRNRKDAIVRRWLDDALHEYPEDAAAAFARQRDPFANPVRHSLRLGTRKIFDALLDGADLEDSYPYLLDIIRTRAVQQFTASQSVAFLFRLKPIVRAELGSRQKSPLTAELAEFEHRIDRVALTAFDMYVHCREQVYQLRVNELKRSASWLIDKVNGRAVEEELVQIKPRRHASSVGGRGEVCR